MVMLERELQSAPPLCQACYAGNMAVVQELGQNYPPPNGIDLTDEAPAPHFAVESGDLAILRYVVEQLGGSVTREYGTSVSPLRRAIMSRKYHIVDYLLGRVDLQFENTRYRYLSLWDDVANWDSSPDCIIARMLVEKGVEDIRRNRLHSAVFRRNFPLLRYLMEELKVDDKNALDDKGRSAMHVACAQWHSGDEAKALMMIKYLVQDVQCDVHIVDVEGKLPEDHMVYKPSRITDDKWERQHEREMEARCERMKKQVINILEVRRNWEGYGEDWAKVEVPVTDLIPCTATGPRVMSPFPRFFSRGSFGDCYWARAPPHDFVAVYKQITEAESGLKQELSPMAAINSPHVVKYLGIVFDKNTAGDRVYTGFLMEKMDCNLLDFMRRKRTVVGFPLVTRLVGHLLEGLSVIHSQGYLHGDLHLRNLLIKEGDPLDQTKLCVGDFGCSQKFLIDPALREAGLEMLGYNGVLPPLDTDPVPLPGKEWTWDIYIVAVVTSQLVLAITTSHDNSAWESTEGGDATKDLLLKATYQCERKNEAVLAEVIKQASRRNPHDRPSADDFRRLLGLIP